MISMKYLLSLLLIASLNIPTFGQQIDCSMVGISVASSGPNYVQLYHSGMYLLWPREPNVIEWEITDFQGNIIHLDTTRGTASTTGTMAFNHNVPPTDSMLVSALIYNDSLGLACLNVDTLWWGGPILEWEITGNTGTNAMSTRAPALLDLTFTAYPSPAFENLYIDGPLQRYALDIYDLNGRHLQSETGLLGETKMDVSHLAPGTYLIRLKSASGQKSLRFIKD